MGNRRCRLETKRIRYDMDECGDQGRNDRFTFTFTFTFHSILVLHAWKPCILCIVQDARGHRLWTNFYARLPAFLCLSNFDKYSFKYSFHHTPYIDPWPREHSQTNKVCLRQPVGQSKWKSCVT